MVLTLYTSNIPQHDIGRYSGVHTTVATQSPTPSIRKLVWLQQQKPSPSNLILESSLDAGGTWQGGQQWGVVGLRLGAMWGC